MIIKEGHEWQVRELSEAALEISQEEGIYSDLESVRNASYAEGVGEVLRMLIANGGDGVDAVLRDSEDILTKIYERYLECV